MRDIRGWILLGGAALLGACGPSAPAIDEAPIETDDQKASYSIGFDMGGQLVQGAGRIDLQALYRGIADAINERESDLTVEERQQVMEAFSASMREDIAAQREAEAAANRTEGDTFRAENAAREEVTVTESGLQWEVVEEGDGPRPGPNDNVTVHYTGTVVDGTEFDTSRDGEPVTFNLGQVIPGFTEGLQLMPVGSTYRFVMPPEVAYGPQGSGPVIGPDATLIFEVELLEVASTETGGEG